MVLYFILNDARKGKYFAGDFAIGILLGYSFESLLMYIHGLELMEDLRQQILSYSARVGLKSKDIPEGLPNDATEAPLSTLL